MRWFAVFALASCVVTQPPNMAQRPRWRLEGDAHLDTACAKLQAFIRKSGKQGIGVTLAMTSSTTCAIAFDGARIVWPREGTAIRVDVTPPPHYALPGRSLQYAWLPIAFDNDAAWNDDRDHAEIEIDVTVAGRTQIWRIPVVQR